MRLIDADELVRRFSDSKSGNTLKRMVDTQPTAYNIDKVVEEFEDHAIEFETFGICSEYVELSHAIEIVKGVR